MTLQERYNILSTFNRAHINAKLGTSHTTLGSVYREFSTTFRKLQLIDPLFLARDLDLCNIELKAHAAHNNN